MAAGDRRFWGLLGAVVALGLALRVAGAQGSLWLDEAWSAVLAHEAGTPLGVFLRINHDNNHHINSLWLQLVGLGAEPLLARALSIATGTAGIAVAGLIGRRRDPLAGLVAAAMFALSPLLVTLGSEARGYAPMALALLVAVLLVDRWLAGEAKRSPATALALCFLLGALSQLTILFGFCAVAGWMLLTLWKRGSPREALAGTVRLLLPSALALAGVFAMVIGTAAASGTGLQLGRYDPFDWLLLLHAVVEMFGYALGLPLISIAWLVLPPVLLLLARGLGMPRLAFYWLAILAFPLGLALLHAGNTGHPRYYLVAGLALLLLAAEMIAAGLRRGGWRRWAAALALAAFATGSLVQDVDLARNRRGDPAAAIRAMEARAPQGAEIILDRSTGKAMLEVAAAHDRYPLRILGRPCGAARFLFLDRFRGENFPAASIRCGRRYLPVAGARARGLSGTHWTLYEVQP